MVLYKGQDTLTDITHIEGLPAAFVTRALYTYKWATVAEKTAQAGMRSGDEGFLATTGETYKYNGTVWKLWHAPVVSVTPSVNAGITLGNGVSVATWSVHAGKAVLNHKFTVGTTTVVTGTPVFNLPAPSPTVAAIFGDGRLYDVNQLAYFDAKVFVIASTNAVTIESIKALTSIGDYGKLLGGPGTNPFVWSAGDTIEYTVAWPL